jgi:23S rRNA (uridine2552-2'-O)-methyltransferase
MARRWLKEKKRDYYYRKAKSEAYRSRASFKLKQLNKKFGLIKENNSVLDLGAAPGGWMQVAGEVVGRKGVVVGVDIADIEPFKDDNIVSIKGDITKNKTIKLIMEHHSRFDVVVCDASPDISGVWDIDHFNSIELARHALGIATNILKEGGNFLVKVFQGSLTKEFAEEVRREFEFTKITKPKASRQQSSEVYIAGKGLLKAPVKYGDIMEVVVSDKGKRGYGIVFLDGFKVLVKDGAPEEKVKVRIKKVSKDFAKAIKV